MEKQYKLIEELQKIYGKELSFKIYVEDWNNIGSSYIEIRDIYTIDNKIINKIQEYTKEFFINVNYKKLELILIIKFNEKTTTNMVSNNIQNNRI